MRTVVFHADDLGMCHAANTAFASIAEFGLTRCGSVMVPCPWFQELAQLARENPAWDIGVHLTLTSEWETYRWGPISTRSKASGMLDDQGCFWRTSAALLEHLDAEAGKDEMRAQIETALSAGIDVTHLDTHMGTAFSSKLFASYLDLAVEYRLPAFITPIIDTAWPYSSFDRDELDGMREAVSHAIRRGLPLFQGVGYERLDKPEHRIEQYEAGIENVADGLTHYLYHASTPGSELTAIAPDHASREGDLAVFTSPRFREAVGRSRAQLLGYRDLRDALRASLK